MFHVRALKTRPAKETVAAFKDIGSATIHESAGRIGAVDPKIKSLAKGVRLLGTAFTVQCSAKDNLMLHKALQIAQEGDVLVVTADGYLEAGYLGGLMATSAMARKLGGLAIEGCVRDSEEVLDMGFPVFCTGTCIYGTTKRGLGLINHPTVFGGVVVHPGDLIAGDDDGLVVVPQADLDTVLGASRERTAKEEEKTVLLSSGITGVELNGLDNVFTSLGLKEEQS